MTLMGSVLKLNLKTAIESDFLINYGSSRRIVPKLAENSYHCAKSVFYFRLQLRQSYSLKVHKWWYLFYATFGKSRRSQKTVYGIWRKNCELITLFFL